MTTEPSDFSKVLRRLKVATESQSDTELASKLGLSQGSISGAKQKQKLPPAWIVQVAKDYGVCSDWLLFGTGPIFRTELKTPAGVAMAEYCDVASDAWTFGPEEVRHPHGAYATLNLAKPAEDGGTQDHALVMVPKVRARLSAGSGSLETSDEVDGRYAFKASWLRSKGLVGKMVLMDVTGDSMEPDIRDRDMVLIDQSQTAVIAGAVYAVGIDDEVLIKHVDKEPGVYILRSANRDYRPISIDLRDESLNVRVIGRIIWWCREAR